MKLLFDRITATISVVFSPVILLPITTIIYLLDKNVSTFELQSSLGLFFLFGFLPIILLLIILRRLGKISDWDMRNRQERHLFNVLALIINFCLLIVLYSAGDKVLFNLLSAFLLWFIGYAVITRFWKISAHTSGYGLFFWLVVASTPYWFMGLLGLGLVVWARILHKHHTLTQTLAGFLFSTSVYLLIHYLSFI